MKLEFTQATPDNAEIIGSLVVRLTQEICDRTNVQHFDIDLESTIQQCEALLWMISAATLVIVGLCINLFGPSIALLMRANLKPKNSS